MSLVVVGPVGPVEQSHDVAATVRPLTTTGGNPGSLMTSSSIDAVAEHGAWVVPAHAFTAWTVSTVCDAWQVFACDPLMLKGPKPSVVHPPPAAGQRATK
jgi:hypothetical protein